MAVKYQSLLAWEVSDVKTASRERSRSLSGKPGKANVWTGFRPSDLAEDALGAPGWGLMMACHETSFHYIYIYFILYKRFLLEKLAVMIGFGCQDSIA